MQGTSELAPVGEQPLLSVFEDNETARKGYAALRSTGISADRIGVLGPFQRPEAAPTSGLAGIVGAARLVGDDEFVLRELGVPDGWLRFYLPPLKAGGSMLLVQADGDDERVQQILREHAGVDIAVPGRDLVRGEEPSGGNAPVPPPLDVARDWAHVRSGYRTLWAQHFGAQGGEFEQVEPIYVWAWEQANRPGMRGFDLAAGAGWNPHGVAGE